MSRNRVVAAMEKETVKRFRFSHPNSYTKMRNVILDLVTVTAHAHRDTACASRTPSPVSCAHLSFRFK